MKSIKRWFLRLLLALILISLVPVLAWKWLPPPMSAVMLHQRLDQGHWPEYNWAPLEKISPEAALAVVAAEDQKYSTKGQDQSQRFSDVKPVVGDEEMSQKRDEKWMGVYEK